MQWLFLKPLILQHTTHKAFLVVVHTTGKGYSFNPLEQPYAISGDCSEMMGAMRVVLAPFTRNFGLLAHKKLELRCYATKPTEEPLDT